MNNNLFTIYFYVILPLHSEKNPGYNISFEQNRECISYIIIIMILVWVKLNILIIIHVSL